jgi:hypothetical protein
VLEAVAVDLGLDQTVVMSSIRHRPLGPERVGVVEHLERGRAREQQMGVVEVGLPVDELTGTSVVLRASRRRAR